MLHQWLGDWLDIFQAGKCEDFAMAMSQDIIARDPETPRSWFCQNM